MAGRPAGVHHSEMVEDSEEKTEMDEVKQRIIQELVPGKQI